MSIENQFLTAMLLLIAICMALTTNDSINHAMAYL